MYNKLLTFGFLSLTSVSALSGEFTDAATLISATPTYVEHRIATPYQHCYNKDFYEPARSSASNELLGTLIGGAIGNRFGKGDGRDAMTVIGAIIGTSVAREHNNHPTRTVSREICETRYNYSTTNQLSHYDIAYEYNNRLFKYRSKTPPTSPTFSVRISIQPL